MRDKAGKEEEKHARTAKKHTSSTKEPCRGNEEANGSNAPGGGGSCGGGSRGSVVDNSIGFSVSVSESSGSIVNKRMFERSAPPAPGGPRGLGLDRAWLVGQAHQALLFGKGGEHDEYQAEIRTGKDAAGAAGGRGGEGAGAGGRAGGWGGAADAAGRRRGHREADQLKLLDAIVRGVYEVEESCVGGVGADFIAQVCVCVGCLLACVSRVFALRACVCVCGGVRPSRAKGRIGAYVTAVPLCTARG